MEHKIHAFLTQWKGWLYTHNLVPTSRPPSTPSPSPNHKSAFPWSDPPLAELRGSVPLSLNPTTDPHDSTPPNPLSSPLIPGPTSQCWSFWPPSFPLHLMLYPPEPALMPEPWIAHCLHFRLPLFIDTQHFDHLSQRLPYMNTSFKVKNFNQ